jgi:hypothetical protein
MARTFELVCLIGLCTLCLALDESPSVLPGNRVSFDALVWSPAHFYRFGADGLYRSEFAFDHASSLMGITGAIGRIASARVSVDVGYLQPQDIDVDLRLGGGVSLRAGQFLLPLGMDVLTEPEALPFATNSLMANYAKPNGTRDIGILASWERVPFTAAVAVVNGTGPNRADNNGGKDVCGRVVLRPFSGIGLQLALRAYWGWPGLPDSAWQSAAGEAVLDIGKFWIQAELQGHSYSDVSNYAGYALLRYETGLVEPCCRIEWVVPRGRRPDVMLMVGPNVHALDGHIKMTVDGFYRRDYRTNSFIYGCVFRLQAVM